MLQDNDYDDGRGRYLDRIKFGLRAPVGFRDVVKRAAEAERVSASEFIRQAIERRVSEVLKGEHAHG